MVDDAVQKLLCKFGETDLVEIDGVELVIQVEHRLVPVFQILWRHVRTYKSESLFLRNCLL